MIIKDQVRLAHPVDIGAMKINAIVGRGSRKDFFDIYELTLHYHLSKIIKSYREKYQVDNHSQALMSLLYFEDAEDNSKRDNIFQSLKEVSWQEVKEQIIKAVKEFEIFEIVEKAVHFFKNEASFPKEKKPLSKDAEEDFRSKFEEKYGYRLNLKEWELIIEKINEVQSN